MKYCSLSAELLCDVLRPDVHPGQQHRRVHVHHRVCRVLTGHVPGTPSGQHSSHMITIHTIWSLISDHHSSHMITIHTTWSVISIRTTWSVISIHSMCSPFIPHDKWSRFVPHDQWSPFLPHDHHSYHMITIVTIWSPFIPRDHHSYHMIGNHS